MRQVITERVGILEGVGLIDVGLPCKIYPERNPPVFRQ